MMKKDNHRNQEVQIYSLMSWKEKIAYHVSNLIIKPIRSFRFPIKSVVVLFVLAIVVGGMYFIVKANQVAFPVRAPYDKSGFVDASVYVQEFGNQTILEQFGYQFVFQNQTSLFQLVDLTTNTTYRSNPNTTTRRFLDPFVVYYAGSLGQELSLGVYDNAITYQDFKIRRSDNGIEVLYEVGGKKDIDRSDFPTIISDERMQELILSKLTPGSTDYRRVSEQAYVYGDVGGKGIWKLKEGIQVSILRQLYRIFYDVAGYTSEDLLEDLESNGILFEDIYPYFEFIVRYQLTPKGLEVSILNDSIVEKEKYKMVGIDLLPFFGASGRTDSGYSFVPDGSGALIDYNSERSFSLPYSQRIYGSDQAIIQTVQSPSSQDISLPVYGMLTNGEGFIAIAKTGEQMGVIRSRISSVDSPYNQTFYKFLLRENQTFKFAAVSSSVTITEWTRAYSKTDFVVEYQFLHEEANSYSSMASLFQAYLLEKGFLTPVDQSNSPVLDLTLLGGYVSKENFLGFPYESVKSLTTTKQANQLVMSLIQSGIQDINVFYQGFTNEGLKPTYFGQTAFDRATGSRRDFSTLIAQMKASNVQVYPEILMNQAYTDQSIRVNEDVIRDVFSNVVKNYAFNPATMYVNPSARPVYTLHTSTYSKTTNAILRLTSSLGNKNIAFGDAGTQSYGSYLKKDVFFRNDQQMAIQAVLTSLQDQSIQMMFRNPRMFALSYAKVVTDIPMQSTDYQIISRSVPFYPLVLIGNIDYSGQSENIADFYPF